MAVAGDSQSGWGQLLAVGGAVAGGWGASKGMRQGVVGPLGNPPLPLSKGLGRGPGCACRRSGQTCIAGGAVPRWATDHLCRTPLHTSDEMHQLQTRWCCAGRDCANRGTAPTRPPPLPAFAGTTPSSAAVSAACASRGRGAEAQAEGGWAGQTPPPKRGCCAQWAFPGARYALPHRQRREGGHPPPQGQPIKGLRAVHTGVGLEAGAGHLPTRSPCVYMLEAQVSSRIALPCPCPGPVACAPTLEFGGSFCWWSMKIGFCMLFGAGDGLLGTSRRCHTAVLSWGTFGLQFGHHLRYQEPPRLAV